MWLHYIQISNFFGIAQKPLDPTTICAGESCCTAIDPVEVHEGHSGGIELGSTLDKSVMPAVLADHSLSGDGIAFT
jgi:hypothetical protein